jgi:hypothetical protein
MEMNYNLSDEALEAIVVTAGACDQVYTIVNTYVDPCV